MLMDGEEDSKNNHQNRVKTFAPEVLAAILDSKESLETLFKTEENANERVSGMEILDEEQSLNDRGSVGVDDYENGESQNDFLRDSLNQSMDLEVTDSLESEVPNNLHNRISTANETSYGSVTDETRPEEYTYADQNFLKQKSELNKEENRAKGSNLEVKTKPKQQKPKKNFIDRNKHLGKGSVNNSYAARFQQKVRLKQAKDNKLKKSNGETVISDKNTEENIPDTSQNSEHYDNFDLTTSSGSFIGNPQGLPSYSSANSYGPSSNLNGHYNTVENSYSRASMGYGPQSQISYTGRYQGTTVDRPYQYLNQPYQTPYRDFGLRYSNHGQGSYHTSSALPYTYPHHRPLPPVSQGYGKYASQSAPPVLPYHARQPLVDQVEFYPEHGYDLSMTLPNSYFIRSQQRFQNGSVLERKFVSEPQLSQSPVLTDTNRQERGSKASGSYISPRQPVDYKPYTLKDYKQIKEQQLDHLGSLGPNVDSDDYRIKINKMNKQKEYAEMLRNRHANLKPQWEKNAAPLNIPPARQKQAEAKRIAAMNYAKTVPKPKLMSSRRPIGSDTESHSEAEAKEMSVVELLKLRHEKEKNEVDLIRKDIASKIRQ